METTAAITMLSALAHENRLALFRLLVGAGEVGLSAGSLAEYLGIAPSTLSHHLALLEQSGLIQSRRQSRHIYYSMIIPQVRSLLSFLVNDCCNGRPDLCDLGQPKC